jgi:ubiquinone/menaquinone biosynthesis C-methylase UbiE
MVGGGGAVMSGTDDAGNAPIIELYNQDAKDIRAFLDDGSVDNMFAMNVVYFLDQPEDYLTEVLRALKPGGSVTFGVKPVVKAFRPPFVNTEVEPILDKMRLMGLMGFGVTSEKIDLGKSAYNYIKIKGIKKPFDVL